MKYQSVGSSAKFGSRRADRTRASGSVELPESGLAIATETDTRSDGAAISRRAASPKAVPELPDVHALDAFCTPIEERFEVIVRIGRRALNVPTLAITVITRDRQWFKSVLGWDVCELPLEDSLCVRTIRKRTAMIIPDLTTNPRYAGNPLVVDTPGFRFYAGIPLMNEKGTIIGTLCAMDTKPHKLSRVDYRVLVDLASLAQRELCTIEADTVQAALALKLGIARRHTLMDPTTRTWNRRGGELLIAECLRRAREDGIGIAVIAVDIDDLQGVNDAFGRATGDRVLRTVARELLANVRNSDGVCRFGGDKFYVVLLGAMQDRIDDIAERIQTRIQQRRIRATEGSQRFGISVSTGTEFVDSGHELATDELAAAIDRAFEKLEAS